MSNRYESAFERLKESGEGLFVPFVVLGDPSPDACLEVLRTLVFAGADALELGIPFSDPVADGPTIQAADLRALAAGTRPQHAWSIVRALRAEFPELPIGLLVYANLVEARGGEHFYRSAAEAGVDSVLIADVPSLEIDPYLELAAQAGILPVMIATPNATQAQLLKVAASSQGYTYMVTRAGVTGADEQAQTSHREMIERLARLGAPPVLLGFGISRAEHVRSAIESGAAGAISGSAVVRIVEGYLNDPEGTRGRLAEFVAVMKAATRRGAACCALPESIGS